MAAVQLEALFGPVEGKDDIAGERDKAINFLLDPKACTLPEDKQALPDFSSPVHETLLAGCETPLGGSIYGPLTARVYASRNHALLYCFYEAADGKAFLASVEIVRDNPLTIYGNRHRCLHLKSMTAPPFGVFVTDPP